MSIRVGFTKYSCLLRGRGFYKLSVEHPTSIIFLYRRSCVPIFRYLNVVTRPVVSGFHIQFHYSSPEFLVFSSSLDYSFLLDTLLVYNFERVSKSVRVLNKEVSLLITFIGTLISKTELEFLEVRQYEDSEPV